MNDRSTLLWTSSKHSYQHVFLNETPVIDTDDLRTWVVGKLELIETLLSRRDLCSSNNADMTPYKSWFIQEG